MYETDGWIPGNGDYQKEHIRGSRIIVHQNIPQEKLLHESGQYWIRRFDMLPPSASCSC